MLSKKNYLFILLFIAALLFGQFSVFAQKTKTGVKYEVPTKLELNGLGKSPEPDERGYVPILTESIFPIGWSKDGKFAYYTEPADEACGCYFAELIIQDLRTDKILWKFEYEGGEGGEETIAELWKKKQKEFSRKLAQYGINAEKDFVLENPSISYQEDIFTPKLDADITTDGVYESLGTVNLWMVSKLKGRKSVYKKVYKPKNYSGFQGAEVSGVLKSPFEPRVAVVLVEAYRGWEGPPNTTRIKIVGSDLTTKFRSAEKVR